MTALLDVFLTDCGADAKLHLLKTLEWLYSPGPSERWLRYATRLRHDADKTVREIAAHNIEMSGGHDEWEGARANRGGYVYVAYADGNSENVGREEALRDLIWEPEP